MAGSTRSRNVCITFNLVIAYVRVTVMQCTARKQIFRILDDLKSAGFVCCVQLPGVYRTVFNPRKPDNFQPKCQISINDARYLLICPSDIMNKKILCLPINLMFC